MIRTQMYLPKHLYQQIDIVAKREQKPKAQIIREMLETGIKKEVKKRNAGQTLLEIAAMAKKNQWKGPKDLSTHIDKYLYKET